MAHWLENRNTGETAPGSPGHSSRAPMFLIEKSSRQTAEILIFITKGPGKVQTQTAKNRSSKPGHEFLSDFHFRAYKINIKEENYIVLQNERDHYQHSNIEIYRVFNLLSIYRPPSLLLVQNEEKNRELCFPKLLILR